MTKESKPLDMNSPLSSLKDKSPERAAKREAAHKERADTAERSARSASRRESAANSSFSRGYTVIK